MKSRLFLKIFAVYVAILVVVITLDSFFVAYQTRQDITRQIKKELITNGWIMLRMPLQRIIDETTFLAQILGARVTIVGATGIVLADSEEDIHKTDNHFYRPEIQEARVKGQGSAIRYSQTMGINMMYVALPLKDKGTITAYVRLSKPIRQIDTAISHFNRTVFRAAIVILVSFLLLALFFIPKLISPILRISEYTEKVRGKKISGSLIVQSRDEIGQLADNINLLVQKYEDNLRLAFEESQKLEAAFASMVEGIILLDRENRINRVNKGMMDIISTYHADIIGRRPLEIFRNVELQDNLTKCRETGESFSQEIHLGEDNQKVMNVNVSPIKGLPEGDDKIIMVFHDVTQLRKLEMMRADFIANVTHEIKTPLTTITGFVQTLQEGAMKDETKLSQFLDIISKNALRLNRLVDDLLTLSSIEIGGIRLHFKRIDARDPILQAIAVVESKAKEKGLVINKDWPDSLPMIMADHDSIIQILVNVLDNAVKFTNSGSITVSVSQDQKEYLSIAIADTGIGIPRNEIPRLGERFYRVDKTRSRELGGTGLGLSIVKHLLKAHNGCIEIESHVGVGTVVKLQFPVFVNVQET